MVIKIAILLGVHGLAIGVLIWYFLRRHEAKQPSSPPSEGSIKGHDRSKLWRLLDGVRCALSEHDESLDDFEKTLRLPSGQSEETLSAIDAVRRANHRAEQAIKSTLDGLLATCDDLLTECSLVSYRVKTNAIDASLDGIQHGDIVKIATTLLEMVCELRADNKVAQHDVAGCKERIIELLSRANSAEQCARVDALTTLPNRRAFDESFAKCADGCANDGHPFSMIFLDIDHFKFVNDTYGHAAGDAVLSLTARVLRETCKTSDHLCRLGGVEFGLLLPRCDERAAIAVAETYRKKIESTVLRFGGHEIMITVSCGVAQGAPGISQSDLMERAGIALYAAKDCGRNKTLTTSDIETSVLSL
jgi:diguanylate cyclase (GGDEF)-like protein